MHLHSVLGLSLLCSAASALPAKRATQSQGFVSLPLTKSQLPRRAALQSRQDGEYSAIMHNQGFGYYVDAAIGTPPQNLKLLVDTGSSDIWVFDEEVASTCSDCTDTYFKANDSSSLVVLPDLGLFTIGYGDGSAVGGFYAADIVNVGGAEIPQAIGVAVAAKGSGFDNGLFGIGLDEGESITKNGSKPYPGYVQTLRDNSLIDVRAYSVYLNSKNFGDTATGQITFGGYNSDHYTGDLVAFPMIEPAPDAMFRLDIAEPLMTFNVGDGPVSIDAVSDKYAVLLDTGAASCSIPTEQFDVISKAVGAEPVENSSVYHVDCALAQKADGMTFDFEGPNGKVTISVPWAEMVIAAPGLPDGRCALGLKPRTEEEAEGLYILGDTFLRSAYMIFNFDESTISLAQVNYDDQTHSEKTVALRRK